LKRIYRIDINDYLEYRRSSSAYITKLACLVHLFAYQSHLTKETKGQSVQMFRLIYLAMVLQAEGSQSDVRRERWLKELQYTLYTITLLLNEQKLHPNTNLTSQTSHTKLQEQKKKKTKREEEDKKRRRRQKEKRNCRKSNPESSPTCPILSSRNPSIQWGRPDSNAGRDFSDALATEPQLLFVSVCEFCKIYVDCIGKNTEGRIHSE
jgi:hypothetical protein